MMRTLAMAFAALAVSACAGTLDPADTVRSAEAAIDIGRNVCVGSNKVLAQSSPPWTWHAVLLGDKWRVWRQGDARDNFQPEFEVYIAKRGGQTSDCNFFVS